MDQQYPRPQPALTAGNHFLTAFVVILCALVLAAILFPVFAQPHSSGPRPLCIGSIKQLGLAQAMYANDNDNLLPPAVKWESASWEYYKSHGLRCPLIDKTVDASGYAFNAALSEKVLPPDGQGSEVPLLYDSTTLERNAHDRCRSLPIPGRHGGKNSIAFQDFHARAMSVEQSTFLHPKPWSG